MFVNFFCWSTTPPPVKRTRQEEPKTKKNVDFFHCFGIRGQQIRRGINVSGGVEGDQAFARQGIDRCRRLTIVGGVYESVHSVSTEQPMAAEPS